MAQETDPPKFRSVDWATLVRAYDPKKDEPYVVYQFSNDRKFVESPLVNPYTRTS